VSASGNTTGAIRRADSAPVGVPRLRRLRGSRPTSPRKGSRRPSVDERRPRAWVREGTPPHCRDHRRLEPAMTNDPQGPTCARGRRRRRLLTDRHPRPRRLPTRGLPPLRPHDGRRSSLRRCDPRRAITSAALNAEADQTKDPLRTPSGPLPRSSLGTGSGDRFGGLQGGSGSFEEGCRKRQNHPNCRESAIPSAFPGSHSHGGQPPW
jgi:hypothetical protein